MNGASSDREPAPETVPDLRGRLHAIGAETETSRTVKRILPWVVSVAVHVGLLALGFAVTWTVIHLRDEEPLTIVADFDALAYEPVARPAPIADLPPTPIVAEARPLPELPAPAPDPIVDPLALVGDIAPPQPAFTPSSASPSASFVGLSSTNARRIVYVIDASGSMIGALPIVLDELDRSLAALAPPQEFGVIFFSRNDSIVVPPARRLLPATEAEKTRVMSWIGANVIPAGRSNPVNALEAALSLRPDVIFLLSENITGSGEFEIDQTELLTLLDRLNPRDAAGRRATRINCIQFLDPDPLGTFERIAAEHGGADGYKFLDRAELGLQR